MFKSVSHERTADPDLVVCSLFSDASIPATWGPEVVEAVKRPEFKTENGQIVETFAIGASRNFVLGLGPSEKFTSDSFRKAIAALGRRISASRVSKVLLDLDGKVATEQNGRLAGETLGLLGWRFDEFKGSGSEDGGFSDIKVCSVAEAFDKGLALGLAIAESVNLARTCAATPPNVATPAWMAGQAVNLESLGLTVTVLRGADLEREHMAGLINVGKASNHEPCFIRIEYSPVSSPKKKPVVLLGKTITYDTGGLAIKTREGMTGMKGDKSGGCAVLGAMHAIAKVIKPDFPVVGLLVAAENSISDRAFRMDDVLTFRNGVTVEVTNTDAEGRLVLADGLCWACDVESPECIVDLATLTGGVVIALGRVFAGLFANDEGLASTVGKASEASGEKTWRLPLHPDYAEMIKSYVADIVNSAASRGAHPVMGATFLSKFVKDGVPWAHIDIAGTAKSDSDKDEFVVGPTGFGVRLLVSLIEAM